MTVKLPFLKKKNAHELLATLFRTHAKFCKIFLFLSVFLFLFECPKVLQCSRALVPDINRQIE